MERKKLQGLNRYLTPPRINVKFSAMYRQNNLKRIFRPRFFEMGVLFFQFESRV
jgi:hypothetical protein